MRSFGIVCLFVAIACLVGGCGGSNATQQQIAEVPAEPATPPPAAPAAPPPPLPNVTDAITSSVAPEPAKSEQLAEPAEPEQEMEREKADVGAGKRGRGYGGGIISTPVRSYFRVRQRAVFQIQLPQAERMYKAEHDGKHPASHDDYMRDIIAANSISLPELPEGETYFYDAEADELTVQRPKR